VLRKYRCLGTMMVLCLAAPFGCRSAERSRELAPSLNVPSRVVSLAPAVDETIIALGKGSSLVGVSDYSRGSLNLPRVGSVLTPGFEGIARLRPTLIVATSVQGANEATLNRLAPTRLLPWLTPPEVADSIEALGEMLGVNGPARELAQRFRKLPLEPEAGRKRVLLLLPGSGGSSSEVWFLRKNSLHGALLHQAGAMNAVNQPISGAARLSFEELLRVNPDAIVILSSAAMLPLAEELQNHLARFSPLLAIRERRLCILSSEDPLGVGPEVLKLAPQLQVAFQGLGLLREGAVSSRERGNAHGPEPSALCQLARGVF
jgi:ABC-type hemin transport system substrate-binding protein